MSEIALLIAFLTSASTFKTPCVQTQDSGQSGYAIDSLSFDSSGKLEDNQASVSIVRTMYADERCQGAVTFEKTESGRVTFAKASGGFFATQDGEQRFDADWELNPTEPDQKELGSIGISRSKGEVRIARNSPGSMRNSMLQLISFKASK